MFDELAYSSFSRPASTQVRAANSGVRIVGLGGHASKIRQQKQIVPDTRYYY
jgi:gamma-glutamylcysteine synthetase